MNKRFLKFFMLFCFSLLSFNANAALIQRTITIDGTMTDWTAATNILTNSGQFSTDCQDGEVCELDAISGSGRDLASFAFTWDNTNLYLYVSRHSAASPTTDWLFYLDENANNFMETGERIFRVQWQGSNRSTNALLCPYFPVDVINGDALLSGGLGDGYDMPGGSNNSCTTLYSNVLAGSADGFSMESRLAWSALGLAQPENIGFHISSSTGTNLPSQVIDNMNPPNGSSQLFSPDMSIDISSVDTQVQSNSTIVYDITLTNLFFDDFTNVTVDLTLPIQMQYASHLAPPGTVFVDTDADTYPDQWQITTLPESSSLVLQVTVLALPVAMNTNVNVDVLISGSTEADSDASNNSDTIVTLIYPAPELTILKYSSSGATEDPETDVTYFTLVSNTSGFDAKNVVLTEQLPQFSSFQLGSVAFADGPAPYAASGLAVSTVEYFNGITWLYAPVSGQGGAPPGYDATVQQIRITLTGTISDGEAFLVDFVARIN